MLSDPQRDILAEPNRIADEQHRPIGRDASFDGQDGGSDARLIMRIVMLRDIFVNRNFPRPFGIRAIPLLLLTGGRL